MSATRSAGISGVAVAAAAAGGILVYSAIKNASIADTLRALATGQPVVGKSTGSVQYYGRLVNQAAGSASGSGALVGATGPAVAADARKYLGVPYKFGGAQNPQAGFDCSGLVNWVLGHDFGLQLPGQKTAGFDGSSHGPVTGDYYVWTGATSIDRSLCAPGDLVCWPSHIGIATGQNTYIDAPTFGETVHETTIGSGALIRRPVLYIIATGGGEGAVSGGQ